MMLCESYSCKDSLTQNTASIIADPETRVYKVVPQNTDFEKPAPVIPPVIYDQTQDQSDDTLEKIPFYFSNSNNANCPINTCQLMENCDSTPTPKTTDQTNIWAPTSQEIINMATENGDWATNAGATHIFHVNTDPTQLFSYTNLCIQCTNIDKYGNKDQTYTSSKFDVTIQCRGGIDISMADQKTGSSDESSFINLEDQIQDASTDRSIWP